MSGTPLPPDDAVRLIVVTGAGRSGTSMIAGSLSKLGFHVPQPEVRGNDTNPRGHFEPRWVVDFHKRLLSAANVVTSDARPEALELVSTSLAEKNSDELRGWLSQQVAHGNLVVKDPRAFWFRDLWIAAADDLGLKIHFLTMLRHPTEVVGSRDKYYLQDRSEEDRATFEVSNVAGWVNASLVNEWTSRGQSRIFVSYTDLLENWRQALRPVADGFELDLESALTSTDHPVDNFIDADLHRVRTTWDDLDVPSRLRDLADSVWDVLSGTKADQLDHVAQELDELRSGYASMYRESASMALDSLNAELRKGRSQGRRAALNKEREAQRQLRQRAVEAEARAAAAERLASDAQGRTGSVGVALDRTRRFGARLIGAARRRAKRLRRP